MEVLERARSLGLRVRAAASLLPHVHELYRGGHASAAVLLERNAREFPGSPALLYLDQAYTWTELDEHANRWARCFLGEGVARGDVIALVMDNRPEYVFALLAASKIGAVTACVNTNLSGGALAHAIRIGKPRVVLAGSEHEASIDSVISEVTPFGPPPKVLVHLDEGGSSLRDPINDEVVAASASDLSRPRPDAGDPMAYLYTSGTTGLPKAAIVTNQRFLLAGYFFGKIMHQASASDVVYVALPFYHGTGQWGGLGTALTTGACLALRRKFSASNFWKDVVRYRATRIMYIGELCRYLLHQPATPDDTEHSVRIAVGNGLRPDVWDPFQQRFGIPLIREFYGATEGNAPVANIEGKRGMLGRLGRGQAVIECDLETGKPRRDARGRCVRLGRPGETGLLVGRISRTARFDGYVDRTATDSKILRDVFAAGDAYFDTGDLVTLHDMKWLSFADRVGDTFRWKGENVSTSEVALLLNAAPGVAESNVFGVSVPETEGKAGMACLVVAPDFDIALFGRYAGESLPKYARPVFVRLLAGMQVTTTLKHQKTDYRGEGYDPARVKEPLYALIDGAYRPISRDLYAEIRSGKVIVG